MNFSPSKIELNNRISKLFSLLNQTGNFDTAIIINKINQYYFTGTLQDGLLVLRSDGSVLFFVRKSFERAKIESPLENIYKISTYKDMLSYLPSDLGNVYLETEVIPVATLDRIKKYFDMNVHPLDRIVLSLRSIKSDFEIEITRESGRQHQYLMHHVIPQILREGMSETDFMAELYGHMIKLGHQGVSRFSMFQMEMVVGQIGFGDTSIYPTNFDGPGGMLGMSPAVPIIGNRERYLKKGDLVFVDVGYGVSGYHTDKTQVYSFGAAPSKEATDIHNACIKIQNKTAELLTVNSIPADIYKNVMNSLPEELSKNFMGYGESVKFLGHGVGLQVDEYPIIANGFKAPLKDNMVIALEPKCGIANIGMVGVEETYIIQNGKAICVTGGPREIIQV